MAKQTQAQLKAKERYNKEKTITLCLRLNKGTDKDIIDYLDNVHYEGETKQGLIKRLIREELAANLSYYKKYYNN